MSSKIIIVDENDNIITYKEREKLDVKDIWRVSALWLTNSKGEILMARRALNKIHNPGKWGPAAAGTVEEGETYDFNIIKETEEEIGLKNIEFKKVKKIKTSTGKFSYFCQWYLAETDQPLEKFKIQKSEVAEVKWFSKEEIKKRLRENPGEFIYSVNHWIGLFL
ncbi:NUDIX domain-containing protein [Patescibacteria group bacterium]|nr:NUDIX domain-containing protein [Patescibacteria group bacterium]MBU4580340.1 NUDIX domain-containing protein [Patescibacteria group bacterium]